MVFINNISSHHSRFHFYAHERFEKVSQNIVQQKLCALVLMMSYFLRIYLKIKGFILIHSFYLLISDSSYVCRSVYCVYFSPLLFYDFDQSLKKKDVSFFFFN